MTDLEQYKEVFFNQVVAPQLSLWCVDEKDLQDAKQIAQEMGYVDYLLKNCHSLVLNDDKLEHLVQQTVLMDNMAKELIKSLGEKVVQELDETVSLKSRMWWTNFGDEFKERWARLAEEEG